MYDPKALKTIQQRLNAMGVDGAKPHERERRKLAKRPAELDKLFSALYEDKVMERISERDFDLMSGKYEKEQLETDMRLKEIDAELSAKGISDRGVSDFFGLISRYNGISELTAATVNMLIDKIEVSERKNNVDGVIEQRITIYYKFVGSLHEIDIPIAKRVCQVMSNELC